MSAHAVEWLRVCLAAIRARVHALPSLLTALHLSLAYSAGGAGCDEGLTDYSNAPLNATKWSNYVNGQDYGLTLLRIQDANTLRWDFRRATDGSVLKSITLTRQH
jgi:hypothetical protein